MVILRHFSFFGRRDSVDSIATTVQAGRFGDRTLLGQRNLSISTSVLT